MAPSAWNLKVACLTLLCCSALVDSRAARKKRQVDSNLVGQTGGSASNLCQPLPAPAHGTIACGAGFPFYACTASCDSGYKFPSGLTSDKRECDQMFGEWFDPPGKDIPDCVPNCDPKCDNGGLCILPNTCTCQNGFMGKHCQYPASNCASPPDPQNGKITCNQDTSGSRCTVSCNSGFKPKWTIAPEYVCSPDGFWAPHKTEIPDCVSLSTVLNTTHTATSTNHPSTGSARCVAWGQDHYRTFDNKVYHYKGSCSYVLVKDAVANSFHIHVKNDKNCQPGHRCKRELEIFMGKDIITLERDATGASIKWNGQPVTIPSNRGGVIFEKVSHYTIIRSNIGFQVRWDGYEMVFVTVTDELRGKTQGLCGVYDGDQTNDFTTDTGSVVSEPASFVTTWKRSLAGETCADTPQTGCSTADAQVVAAASASCEILNGQDFAICHHAVDPARYISACKEDCCSQSGHGCSCSSLEAYASECLSQNIELNWRSNSQCPVQCPNNQVHKECGSMCQKTCQSPVAACETHDCIDGCFCPDDMVLHNDVCIPKSECPCTLNNKEYKSGDVVPKECNKCTCLNGAWQCTNKKCEATCSAIGDPHYMTFDGKRYDFMGTCSYYLIYDPNFDIIADNMKCGHGQASCTKSVTIHINGHQIKMDHNHVLFIDGAEVTSTPYENDGIKLYMVSSLFMKAELSNGIKILWDGRTRAYITVPPTFVNKTKGLCGTYDFNQKNDFRTKEGDIETNINAFGNRWKTVPTCTDIPINATGHPCDENVNRRNQSEQYCAYLKGDIFKTCNDVVDPEDFYKSCLYDMCACSENLRDCLCPMLGEYASTCAAAGVNIHWRLQVPECHVPCKGGQEYQVCPNECTRTCYNIANDPGCVQSSVCAEGCACPTNQTLDDNGNCIAIAQCPCKFSGQEFAAGTAVERGDQICSCFESRWTCAAKPTNVHIGGVEKICPPDMEYSTCISDCPATCQNMNNATATMCNTTTCRDGCMCKPGYVREGNVCVLKSECPCYHGGVAYKEGETFSMDCNECTCRSRLWVCESKDCPAVCSAYGDSHYTTFDGKSYEFQGSCDYVFAKSTSDSPIKFEITTENIPCGTTGVTCTRSISFSIGEQGTANFYRIQLVQGKPVVPDPDSPFKVREVGNFVIITTPQGITLEWDKGTRLYLKLRTEHKGLVEGLCGNFDGNQRNDFTTPQGGPAASRPTTFADSWKVHAFCGNSKEITDTCTTNSERQPWAHQKCNIIASKVFERCHNIVPYQEYVDKCIFDACACDTGGDCECLCTAVAAYAHQCAMNGVPVTWRTEDFCPIMCEDCLAYKACISICPKKTCDNRLVYDSQTQDCGQETCVEGCDIEPCPPGQVYESDKAPLKCIPEAFCNTTCLTINGREYKEGERILDETVCRMDCEVCYCDSNEIKRTGVCTGTTPGFTTVSTVTQTFTTPTPTPAITVTLPSACVQNGPTGWMSVGTPTPFNQGDIESFAVLRRQYTFCDNSQMTAIECRVVGTQTSSAASGQRVFCDLRNGLKCYHSDQINGGQCLNYEVRITCDCGLIITTTIAPSLIPGGSPTIRPPNPSPLPSRAPNSQCKEPGWTNWMNFNQQTGPDDIEVLPNLIKAFAFCREDQIEYIQCRQSSNKVSYDEAEDVNTICSAKGGFACYGAMQPDGQCNDYEIRVYCNCKALCDKQLLSDIESVPNSQFTASSSAPGVSPSDARWSTIGGWRAGDGDQSPWIQVDVIEPVDISGILTKGMQSAPVFTKHYTISYSDDCKTFTNLTTDTGKAQVFEGNSDSDTVVQHNFIKDINARCVRLHPMDYSIAPAMRFELLGCRLFVPVSLSTRGTDGTPATQTFSPAVGSNETPTASPSPQTTLTPTAKPGLDNGKTPTVVTNAQSTPMPYTCIQGWSSWMNIDTPELAKSWETNGPGDVEPLSELRNYYSFCAMPTGIKCQSATTLTPYTDPLNQDMGVSCTLEKGLECLNANQGGYNCDDYEVAVFCDCAPSPPTTTSPTAITGTPMPPKPACGWTTYMNGFQRVPSSTGEYETIHNLRMLYAFCEFPAQIQCRDVATMQDFSIVGQTGVTCDVNHGLVCEDIGQNSRLCNDYEVRVYCTDACASTVSPGLGSHETPTLVPNSGSTYTPTAKPTPGSGETPTASPGLGSHVTPTAGLTGGSTNTPTAKPTPGSGETPTASPGLGSHETPTAGLTGGSTYTPTAKPTPGSGETPTASPGLGSHVTPTAGLTGGSTNTPTAKPTPGSGETPTASPGLGSHETPTAGLTGGSTYTPTAKPTPGSGETPTASPGLGSHVTPTAGLTGGSTNTPTAKPTPGSGETPTASPGLGSHVTPTAGLTGGSTNTPTAKPTPGSGETPTASPGLGSHVTPTAGLTGGSTYTPTAKPTPGSGETPTASPGLGSHETPTAGLTGGSTNTPTAKPTPGSGETPTASPGLGSHETPTEGLTGGSTNTPTAKPTPASGETPTASPGLGSHETPTAGLTGGSTNTPTAKPTPGSGETPTASPGLGSHETPTAGLTGGSTYTPTAKPTPGSGETPTASPGLGSHETPTATPGKPLYMGSTLTPTAKPTPGSGETPTASPGLGSHETPTAGLTGGSTNTPTTKPTPGSGETPNASPSTVSEMTPTTDMLIPWFMICHEGWTDWINDGNPTKQKGDFESYKSIPGYPTTCDEIVTSECAIASTGQRYSYSGQDVKCNRNGLECVDGPMQTCLDYKIRFFCSCRPSFTSTTAGSTVGTIGESTVKPTFTPGIEPTAKPNTVIGWTPTRKPTFISGQTPTASPPTVSGGSPTMRVTPVTSAYSCLQGWTKPMSVSTPSVTGDDLELMTDLRTKYEFCNATNIVAIRCTGLISEKTAQEMGEEVICERTNGLTCYGKQQSDGKCEDYAVQVYCDCRITTPYPDTTTTVVPPLISGQTPTLRPPSFSQVTPTARPPLFSGETPTPRPYCDIPLGVADYLMVSNSQLSATTAYNFSFEASNGRLNGAGAWMPRFSDNAQWLQVDFGEHKSERIAGVLTQGRPDADQWVESFYLETSMDGQHWYRYTDVGANKPTTFLANFDRNSAVPSMLDRELDARFVRILPKSWHGAIALRFEILSCYGPVPTTLTPPYETGATPTASPGLETQTYPGFSTNTYTDDRYSVPTAAPICLEPMGIDNSLMVKDNQLKASTEKDRMSGAATARLYNEFGGWQPSTAAGKQWIQVDFLRPKYISGVLTQGLPNADKWTTKFYISTSKDGMTFIPYSEVIGGPPKIFYGNNDRESIVKNVFTRNVEAQYVRLNVIEGGPYGIGMRFNLIGCYSAVPTPGPATVKTDIPTAMPTPGVTQILPVCTIPMGVENRYIISVSQIKASSEMGSNHSLSKREAVGVKMPWTPNPTDQNPWIEIDFLEPKTLSGVITKGHAYKAEWVTSFQVYTSLDGKEYTPYSHVINSTTPTTFTANTDNTTGVTNLFNRNIIGRFIRIYPKTWHTAASLMFEILGCNPSKPMWTTPSPSLPTGQTPTTGSGSNGTPKLSTTAQQTSTTTGFGFFVPPMPNFTEPPRVCLIPMGLQSSLIIASTQFSASSQQGPNFEASQGRIYSSSGWAPSPDDKHPWIQVDFKRPKLISGIRTQAEKNGSRWITKYTVSTSVDGKTFIPYSDKLGETTPKEFTGNSNNFDLTRHLFNRNITAQYVRIYPVTWQGTTPALRFNIIGCNPDIPHISVITTATPKTTTVVISPNATTDSSGSPVTPVVVGGSTTSIYGNLITVPGLPLIPPSYCVLPMGIENQLIIKDQQLSASSSKDVFTGAERARLYGDKDGSFSGAWVAGENNLKQYIQVDFLAPYYIGGVVTQGRTDEEQWVTKYEIFYSTDGKHYQSVPRSVVDNTPMVFTGNSDRNTPETHIFPMLAARWIRIHPLEWHGGIAMRFNMLGCTSPTNTPLTVSTSGTKQTPTPTGSTPRSDVMATACAYWTPWVSASKPDMVGEYETAWELRNMISFCDMKYVTMTECRTVGTHIFYDQAGEENIVCNNDVKGLVCFAQNQTDGSCMDYEIRVFCDECSSTTKTSYSCQSRWLPWVNNMTPTSEINYVEHEFMSLKKQQELCSDGHITRIECQTASGIPYFSTGAVGTTCDVTSGFTCRNAENSPVPCDDMKVRYYCECNATSIASTLIPTSVTSTTPTRGFGETTTAKPSPVSGETPTAQPSPGSGGTPTAKPSPGSGGTPTAQPSLGSGGTPTAQPSHGSGGTPTAQPSPGSGGIPTAQPSLGSGETPTAQPSPGSGETPTAQPTPGSGQTPTAQPTFGSGGTPTAQPSPRSGETPTAQPTFGSGGTPTAQPSPGSGETPTAQPSPRSGETPTAQPTFGSGGTPTAQPSPGSGETPTAKPSLGSGETPTAQPTFGSGGTPTAQPTFGSGGTPTAQPTPGSGETPTAQPTFGSGGTPTAQPSPGSGETPTAQPTFGSGGTPTAQPSPGSGETPTAKPSLGSGETPTAQPTFGSGGTPTAQPTFGSGGTPTAQPTPGSGETPTAQPTFGSGGTPTAHATPGSGETPTAHPSPVSGETPTAQPSLGSGGTPTAIPPIGSGGTPTAKPTFGSGGTPTASPTPQPTTCRIDTVWSNWINRNSPSVDTNEREFMTSAEKSAFCGTGKLLSVECQTIYKIPSYSAGDLGTTCDLATGLTCKAGDNFPIGCQDYMIRYQCQQQICGPGTTIPVPSTLSPGTVSIVTSPTKLGLETTATPSASPTTVCKNIQSWSPWINRDKPTSGTADRETYTGEEKKEFCATGKIVTVECATVDHTPWYDTMEILSCSVENGLECINEDNFPYGCQDYMIRYQCEEIICGAASTPPTASTLTPSASPPGVITYTPTAKPPYGDNGKSPTAFPPVNSGVTPTAQPLPGSGQTPTASPRVECMNITRWSMWINNNHPVMMGGDKESMSLIDLQRFCQLGSINQIECQTVNGKDHSLTADITECAPDTGLVCDEFRNYPVGCLDYKVRYECMEFECSTPTAQPSPGSGQTPTAQPSPGSGETPTAQPTFGSGGTPTAQPTPGSGETPTAQPTFGSGGTPTAQPSPGSGQTPTAQPTFGSGGTPTAQPSPGSGETPTAQPTFGSGGTPTAQPSPGSGETPTAQPSPGSGQTPTAQPTFGSGGTPTAQPTLGSGETPTAQPTFGSGGTPTAQPSPGSGETPTAQPSPGSGETPTAQPTFGSGGTPTAQPSPGSGMTPTAQPTFGSGGTPTARPPIGSGHTPSLIGQSTTVTRCFKTHWSNWINQDNPMVGDGDFESLTKQELAAFCVGGIVSAIECVTDTGIPSYSSGERVFCDISDGFACRNADNAPVPCSDYKIRYLCKCDETSTQATTTIEPPFQVPVEPTLHLRCGWSPWLNGDRPNFGLTDTGDLETIASLKTKFGLCKNIVDIKCRVANTNTDVTAAGQVEVTCDALNGLRCYNRDQPGGMCYDYEVSVLCWGAECSVPPTGPSTITPGTGPTAVFTLSTAVCPPGEIWEPCAIKCQYLCEGYAATTGLCNNDHPCVPMCVNPQVRPVCAANELLKDKTTCVKKEMCPCLKPDGKIAQAYETWLNPTDKCSSCQCANNEIRCTKFDNCSAIPEPSTTIAPPPFNGSAPTIRPVITHPECGWTAWINSDRPAVGSGDLETISKIRRVHVFCAAPVMIECRDVHTRTPTQEISQKVTCDLQTGLKCLNWDNGGDCSDYEVRFFCPCLSTTVSPGLPSTMAPTAQPSLGSGGTPTAQPPIGSGGTPTAQPTFGSGGTPTAQPPIGSGGTPTAQPTFGSGGTPTAQPPIGSGGTPTAQPTFGSGGTPTAQPPIGSGGTPTAQPTFGSGGTPTAIPPIGSGGTPTAQPPIGSGGTPTAQPPIGSGGTPTAQPTFGSGGTPTAQPPIGSGGTPTAQPTFGSGGTPTAQPPIGSGGTPTAQPTFGSGGTPTAQPPIGSGGTPTAQPTFGSGGTPTAIPPIGSGGTPTAQPTFGSGGTPTAQPPIGSGGTPTAQPPIGSGGTPTAQPTFGSGGTPTAQPPIGSGGTPTAQPTFGSGGTPTAIPPIGSGGTPTAQPPIGSGGTPTAQPTFGSGGTPTAQPPIGSGGTPTAQPTFGSGGTPTAQPTFGSGGTPTAQPPIGSGGTPTAQPTFGSGGTPTAQPPIGSGGTPTAQPTFGSGGTPTAIPPIGSGGTPTAQPPIGSGGTPTAQPTFGSGGTPTAQPPIGSGGIPTAQPTFGSGETPTAQPTFGSGGTPTAIPPIVSGGTPTAQPSPGSGGIPTAGPVLCGWTNWMDGHKPDDFAGESELFSNLRMSYQFCKDIDIQSVQCRVVNSHLMINQTQQTNVMCDIATGGLMCMAFDQPSGECLDYEVRVFCEPKGVDCSATPTAAPTSQSTVTPTQALVQSTQTPTSETVEASTVTIQSQVNCNNTWSEWINKDTPPSDGHEVESMSPAEKAQFCPGGKITAIECVTTDGIHSYSTGEIVECSMERGLVCNDIDNFPVPCSDYKIRYECTCPETTTSPFTTTTVMPTPNSNFPVVCQEKMGMESGSIRREMITVSSSRDGSINPSNARLSSHGAWTANTNDKNQYIQVNFLGLQLITGLITQGRYGVPSYVTSYKVYHSTDGFTWTPYQTDGVDKIFTANKDSDSKATNWFEHPIRAQYIRVVPQTWQGVIAMRLEVLGCYQGYPTVATPPPVTTFAPVKIPVTQQISDSCIAWDQWINQGHLSLTSGGDTEPIADVLAASQFCTTPLKIECARASDELPASQTGQVVKCNLWDGFVCFNADNLPLCFDYKVRLGCLKNTPECSTPAPPSTAVVTGAQHGTTLPVTGTVYTRVLPCFEGMDISACPAEGCQDGLYCNGRQCVRKNECPCLVDGKVMQPGSFKENSYCDTCQCIAGEVMCTPKSCPTCDVGFVVTMNETSCKCGCDACETGQFRCGNGVCISNELRCDGIVDCIDDEIGCVSTPMFTPPIGYTGTPNTQYFTGIHTVTVPPVPCKDSWTMWYNRDKPDTGDGDLELLSKKELDEFCPVGKITAIECITTDGIPSYSTGEIMQCSIEGGAVCLNMDNEPIPCSDYKVRYFCKCDEQPTLKPTAVQTDIPTMTPPVGTGMTPFVQLTTTVAKPNPCNSSWSSWINTDSPDSGDGDFEAWTKAQQEAFCTGGHLTGIECITSDGIPYFSTGEIMQCSLEGGSVCLNDDNAPIPCSDYKIRYFCTCDAVPTPAPRPLSTESPPRRTTYGDSGTPIWKSTVSTQSTAPACIDSWSTWINTDNPSIGDGDREGWTKAQQEAFCTGGHLTGIECITTDGIPSYSTGEIMQCSLEGGSVCLNDDNAPIPCSDYKIRYFCKCDVTTTKTVPTTVSSTERVPPTINGKLHTTDGHGHGGPQTVKPLVCLERWSKWINRDTPDVGDGDIEKMNSKELAIFCPGGRVNQIECGTVDGIPSYSSGEITSCSISNGLECLNGNNYPVPCSDYQVRYFCLCTDQGTHSTSIHGFSPTHAPAANHNTGIPVTVPVCVPELCPIPVRPMVKEGEVIRTVMDDMNCCMQYEVFCKPADCAPSTLNCPAPMMVQPANVDDCCPTFRCMCPPQCPEKNMPACTDGTLIEVNAQCNCTQYACLSKPMITGTQPPVRTCKYTASRTIVNGTDQSILTPMEQIHQIGETWTDGLCRQCLCEEKSGSAETSCHEQTCPVCAPGQKTVDAPGQCCGKCKQIGCVVNDKVYTDGEVMPTKRKCYTKQCNYDFAIGLFVATETSVSCPTYDKLLLCKQNQSAYDDNGCCMKCIPEAQPKTNTTSVCETCAPRLVFGQPDNSVGYFKVMDNLELCQNLAPIPDLKECSGYCDSKSSYSHVMRGFTNNCNCCQSSTIEARTVTLTCKSGRTITKSYSAPTACGCSACTGGK